METKVLSKADANQGLEVEKISQLPVQQSSADRFVELAMKSGDMAQLEKMLELKERYDKEESRKAFTAALAAFKAEDISIVKDRTVGFETNSGFTSYTHASLGNIVKIAVPEMAKHGLSHRWEVVQKDGGANVTCVLTHKDGHSESTSLHAAPDASGKKNAIQQISSTITYLERYTFLAITGLAVEEMDDDGQTSEAPAAPVALITEEQALEIHALLSENGIMDNFKQWFQKNGFETVDEMPADYYNQVMTRIKNVLNARKEAKEK